MIDLCSIRELEIEFTTLCNARCPLCYRNYKSFKDSPCFLPRARGLAESIKQLESMPNLEFVMLVGSMSEPTLYFGLFDVIKHLKSRGVRIEICTNGDTDNVYWWRDLGKLLSLEDKVYFTICGSTQELHEQYRAGTSLSHILANAAALRSILPVDYAQCIRFDYNSSNLDTAEFKKMVSQFSHVYMTETFFPKDIDNYRAKFDISKFMPCKEKIKMY